MMHLARVETTPTNRDDLDGIRTVLDETDLFPAQMLDDMVAPFLAGEGADGWVTARVDGSPVGFALYRPEQMTEGTWNVLAIGVRPEHHDRGIGTRLIGHVEDVLRSDGQRVLLVETSGTPEFEATRGFYRGKHYEEVARIPDFYTAGDDKVVFFKRLN